MCLSSTNFAAQTDIPGPAGSQAFGTAVAVLSNGNFVVTDPGATVSAVSAAGAVYLYSPSAVLISTLTGSSAQDEIGSGGVVALPNGNFVVLSPIWNKAAHSNFYGAVTWVNGTTGVSAAISPSNSLVDTAGSSVFVLTNGNFVITSPEWPLNPDGSGPLAYGAATWANGNTGITGTISPSNSLVGATNSDEVGLSGVTPLSNGNYVVLSPAWHGGSVAGAATWGNGNIGVKGEVSSSNSLVGTNFSVSDGRGVSALTNGNYVVVTAGWSNGTAQNAGAVTWANGSTGLTGSISTSNSLYGTTGSDSVGYDGVTALSNGNYVVVSPNWHYGGGSIENGAVTWGNGTTGIVGPVTPSNSLVGTSTDYFDNVGNGGITPLTNGNYVVSSWMWPGATGSGAATWGDGAAGVKGAVSASNSLVGTSNSDNVGRSIAGLSNGNYVVCSFGWNNGPANNQFGAVTWVNGATGLSGPVTVGNSLTGTTRFDKVGAGGATALTNGNYVVASPYWQNGTASNHIGAATWGNGVTGLVGVVSTANSLVGVSSRDSVGSSGAAALPNGDYVVLSPAWFSTSTSYGYGAVTWAIGSAGTTGVVGSYNSLTGVTGFDEVGSGDSGTPGVAVQSDGNYVIYSPNWSGTGAFGGLGAVTLGSEHFPVTGTVASYNSVIDTKLNGGYSTNYAYDSTRHRLLVGRPAEDVVTLFTMDQIFSYGFE